VRTSNGSQEEKRMEGVPQSMSWTSDGKGASPGRREVEQESDGAQIEEGMTLLSAVGAYHHTGMLSELGPPVVPVRTKSNDNDEVITKNKTNEISNHFIKESSQSSFVYKGGSRTPCGSWNSSGESTPKGSPNRTVPVGAVNAYNNNQTGLGSTRESTIHFDDDVGGDEPSKLLLPPTIPKVLGTTSAHLAFEVTRNELDAETDLMRSLDETAPLRSSAGTCDAVLSEVPIDTMDEPVHDFLVTDDDDGLALPVSSSIRTSHSKEARVSEAPSRARARSNDSITIGRMSITSKRKASPAKAHEGGHHRQLTLEENLFGLNRALSFLKMEDDKKRQEAEKRFAEQRTEPLSKGRPGDVFDTASVVFDRITKANASVILPPEEKAKTSAVARKPLLDRRNTTGERKSSATAGDLKKTDGNRISSSVKQDGVDIEGGSLEFRDPRSDETVREGDLSAKYAVGEKDQKSNKFGRFPFATKIKADWDTVNAFWRPRRHVVHTYLKIVVLYIMVPSVGIAAILFHWAENPPTETCPWEGCDPRNQFASASWWVLFLGCRQMIIVTLAKVMELLLVDFLALRTTWTLRLFGPMFTLLMVQWKGWPMLLFFIGLFNFTLTAGDSNFANHWLYWQTLIPMMNRSNPSGYVTTQKLYYLICELSMGVGAAVGVKRLMIGLHFGRRTFGTQKRRKSTEKSIECH
jgi:hypothetical protein